MLTKEELRRRSKYKLIVMIISVILPISVVIIFSIGDFDFSDDSVYNKWKPISYAFPYVLLAGFLAWLIYKIVDYALIIKSDKYLDKKFIYKNDERIRYIYRFTNSLASKIFIYSLSVLILIATFFKHEYFWPLLGVFVLHWICQISVYIYYRNKI
ncbi:MAG: hypothetical protein K6E20_04665 [Acholeplasmatales bacterium]|nr:hypothetical protein [Acholeplasmatales bacterium]